MKTAFLDSHYPKLEAFGGLRQGTLTFARWNLNDKRRKYGRRRCPWRIWSFRHPVTGRMWHCLIHSGIMRGLTCARPSKT